MRLTLRFNLFRRSLEKLSTSPEEYFAMRQRFATSYASMCVGHWILGIGDRHQSNCLVSTKNGQCIGIDFGHAFGTATQFLPVPELVPFRLTPHILRLTDPFNSAEGKHLSVLKSPVLPPSPPFFTPPLPPFLSPPTPFAPSPISSTRPLAPLPVSLPQFTLSFVIGSFFALSF